MTTTIQQTAPGVYTHDHGLGHTSGQGNLRPLSVWQQVLLDTDGTVTHLLELYAQESIVVARGLPVTCTEGNAGGSVLDETRIVRLMGARSGRTYVYAESTIAYEALDDGLRRALLTTNVPIGRLLANDRLETFREIERVWSEPLGSLADIFPDCGDACLLSRVYTIARNGRPIMRICEKFPCTVFALPSPSIA